MPLPILPLLSPMTTFIGGLVFARNTNKTTKTSKEIAEQQQFHQLKLAYLNIQAQENLEQKRQHLQVDLEMSRQQFQEKMFYLGFKQQLTLREFDQQFQERLRQLDYEHQQEIEEFRAKVSIAINQKNLDFQTWKFEQEIFLQKEMALFNRETQFIVATTQRETALQLPEINKINEYWPLKNPPSQILSSHPNHLRIFISPPELDYDRFINLTNPKSHSFPRVESFLGTRLLKLLNQYYPRNDGLRPTQLLDEAWDSKRFAGSSSIVALADRLESEPFVVLETKVTLNKYLSLRVAYKEMGQKDYFYDEVIPSFEYADILTAAAKARIGETDLTEKIQVTSDDWEVLYEVLEVAHGIVACWIADVHHLLYYNATPLLPQLLPELVKKLPDFLLTDANSILCQLMQEVVKGYQTVFHQLEKTERCYQVSDLFLDLANGLVSLPDQSMANEQIKESVAAFFRIRNCDNFKLLEDNKQPQNILLSSDENYFKKLENIGYLVGEEYVLPEANELLQAWCKFKKEVLIMENRLAIKMLNEAKCIKEDSPSIYGLLLKTDLENKDKTLVKCHIGEQDVNLPTEKVLMVLGATGSGKTTLINGMINYIFGVKWEDKFRFQLITEEIKVSQAFSQTQAITAYTIYKMYSGPHCPDNLLPSLR